MASYRDFAFIYDRLMQDIDYDGWFEYIRQIFKEYNQQPSKVLEMACGTGNLTKKLCEARYDVTCFDLSEEMLVVAYEKLRKYKNVKILNQDMTSFNLNTTFDVILSICDSINYLTDVEDLYQSFVNAYNHLEEGGIFVFDINSAYKLKEIIANHTFVHDEDDVFYVWENEFDDETQTAEFYLSFFVKDGEKYTRFDEHHLERAYTIEQITKGLRLAGFKTIDVYEGFTFNAPNPESERINFVVKK